MELAADNVLLQIQRLNRLQNLDFLISNRFAVVSRWSLHGQICKDLKKVILNDIADCACLLVKSASALHSKRFHHGYLHAVDVIAVPERLQKRIDEPKEDEILDRPLSEIMVDAEDCPLVERCEQNSVQIRMAVPEALTRFPQSILGLLPGLG